MGIKTLDQLIHNTSLKNKIFFSTLAVIMLISLLIALFTRWVLISSLTQQLKDRGLGIARSLSESSRASILTDNRPELTDLLFEARKGQRQTLVAYIFVIDKTGRLLAHTFVEAFPDHLLAANPLSADRSAVIRALSLKGRTIYDIAVPITEGIYGIGTVHLGVNQNHIDALIAKLRITFVGFLSAVTVVFFIISHWLARIITKPISELTTVADEIGRGNLDIHARISDGVPCWELRRCEATSCPGYENTEMPCWYRDEIGGRAPVPGRSPETPESCRRCKVYRKYAGDEVGQLSRSFINMTRRLKASERELRESELKYRSLFSSGPNPIFVLDRKNLMILDANPSAEDTYGYSRQELVGRRFTDLGPFDAGMLVAADARDPDVEKACQVSAKVPYRRKDGQPLYVNVHACPARYGGRAALIVETTDITEMVEKDTQLIHASKMKSLGEMSAGIAHELNQPLNAIKMGSDFLKMMTEIGQPVPESDLVQVVTDMSGQVDRASEIIEWLRDFGRKSDFSREKITLNQPVWGVMQIIHRQLKLQNIDVGLELDEALPRILAHKNRLEQVVYNLVANARDAINQRTTADADPEDRRIRIGTFQRADRAVLTISDTGAGIPETLREKIFDPFFTTKATGEGMGLGLSILHGIVNDYGGQIAVESKEGRGTTFTISFPVAD